MLDTPGIPERRQSPRYELEMPADIALEDGEALAVTTRNISNSGLQIICDAWVTDAIEPRGIQSHATSQLRFKLIMELPIADDAEKFYVNCRLISVQRLSQDEYMLNIAFINFENSTESTLNKFIGQYKQRKIVLDAIIV